MQCFWLAAGSIAFSAFVAYCLYQALRSEPWEPGIWANWNRAFVCLFLTTALIAGGFVTVSASAQGLTDLRAAGAPSE